MYSFIKHKFYRSSLTIFSATFIVASLAFVSNHQVLAANTTQAYCFYKPTGTLYVCSNISPDEPASNFTAGACYTNDGNTNGGNELIWNTADCTTSNFANKNGAVSCGDTGNNTSSCAANTTIDPAITGTLKGVCPANDSGCNDLISKYINPVTAFLAAGVGIIVTIMIVVGAIQYATSQDNPQAVSAAKKRIVNAILALVIFGLMYALLNWLVPGGVFNGG